MLLMPLQVPVRVATVELDGFPSEVFCLHSTAVRFPRFRLPSSGWKRRVAQFFIGLGILFLTLLLLGIAFAVAIQSPQVQRWVFEKSLKWKPPTAADLAAETPGKPSYNGPLGDATTVQTAGDFYRTDRIWNVRLGFTQPQWQGIQHTNIPSVRDWMDPKDHTIQLRNPQASRNGLAGVLGFDFPWSSATVNIGGMEFESAGIRFKGNGTYLSALRSYRRPFKLNLSKIRKKQHLAGRTQYNLGNLSADMTCLSDTLGYEFFREAGVPAPRTTFARVFLDIQNQETNRLLGLYVMVENPDADWAREQFGVKNVALFKPVTYDLFSDLGTDWSAYDGIYDPKVPISESQKQRVMTTARWVSTASDEAFAAQAGEFFDLDEVAQFLACEVLLANYDGFLSNGQNFLMYLDPRTQRLGFIPWDLDHAWGEFPFIATAEEREQASIGHPWVGRHRLLERLMKVPAFQERYRQQLHRLLETLFVPERLNHRLDTLAATIRPLVAEWSPDRLAKLDRAISSNWDKGPRDGNPSDPNRPVWQLKRFFVTRAENVRQQLQGKTQGVVLQRRN